MPLLSFLCHDRLVLSSEPSSAALLAEARHFGVESALLASLTPSSDFSRLALQPSALLPLTGRVAPSAVAMSPSPYSASVFAAHGGVVTRFNVALASRGSVLTPLPTIDSLVAVSPTLALASARDFAGVHLCRFPDDAPATAREVLSWLGSPSAPVLSKAATAATEASSPWLFASFKSARRNSSVVVAFDLNSLSPMVEIGRKEVYGADVEAAIRHLGSAGLAATINWFMPADEDLPPVNHIPLPVPAPEPQQANEAEEEINAREDIAAVMPSFVVYPQFWKLLSLCKFLLNVPLVNGPQPISSALVPYRLAIHQVFQFALLASALVWAKRELGQPTRPISAAIANYPCHRHRLGLVLGSFSA
uniref:Uncharacterized protein n=1 Tax=Oryza brachyantha TaxID=4533 RepID=J3MK99_ORYBR